MGGAKQDNFLSFFSSEFVFRSAKFWDAIIKFSKKHPHSANNDQRYLHSTQIPEYLNFTWHICICSYFLETFIIDIAVNWGCNVNQIGCFVDFIHHNYVGFVVDNLMVSLDWEILQNFCWVIFSFLSFIFSFYKVEKNVE